MEWETVGGQKKSQGDPRVEPTPSYWLATFSWPCDWLGIGGKWESGWQENSIQTSLKALGSETIVLFLYHQDTHPFGFPPTYLTGHNICWFSPSHWPLNVWRIPQLGLGFLLFSSYAHSLGNPFHPLASKIVCWILPTLYLHMRPLPWIPDSHTTAYSTPPLEYLSSQLRLNISKTKLLLFSQNHPLLESLPSQ